jgi:hypothetical protein
MARCKSEVNWHCVYWELNQILSKHWLWLESNGEKGVQGDLSWKELPWVEIPNLSLRKIIAKGTNFFKANLAGVDFTDANLKGACFDWANLSRVNFKNAILQNATFREAKRYKTIWSQRKGEKLKPYETPQWIKDYQEKKDRLAKEYTYYEI